MALDYQRLRNLTTREIMSALLHDGFVLRHQSGSHARYVHPDGRRVTVTFHGKGDTFRIKTLRTMIEDQACWMEDDLKRLKLIT